VTFNTASSAVGDRTVSVSARVTDTLLDYGDDLEKDTDDDVTYSIDATSSTIEATLSVLPMLVLSDECWWFNGYDAQNYAEQATLTAVGAATGSFSWSVVAGTAKVDLNNGGADSDAITATDDNAILVKSTGASGTENDISIRLTYQGTMNATIALHVRTPALTEASIPSDNAKNNGYESTLTYQVKDQLNGYLPSDLEANEAFGTWVSQHIGENWTAPTPNALSTSEKYLTDSVYAYDLPPYGGLKPSPVNPGYEGELHAVQSAPQTFRLGT